MCLYLAAANFEVISIRKQASGENVGEEHRWPLGDRRKWTKRQNLHIWRLSVDGQHTPYYLAGLAYMAVGAQIQLIGVQITQY